MLLWHFVLLVPLGLFLLALIQNTVFRERCLDALDTSWQWARRLLIDLPLRIVPLSALRRLAETWVFQLVYWYILKPALFTLLVLLLWRSLLGAWYWPLVVFAVVNVIVNSAIGRAISERVADAMVEVGTMIRTGLLVGMFHFVLALFKQAVEFVEYLLYLVDESLRFRSGDGQVSLVVRTLLGVLWYPISVLARFYMVVVIEPGINPVKLPISLLAAKLMLPLWPVILAVVEPPLRETLGTGLSRAVIAFHIFWLPDVFAFLAWEIKENWSLYRSNRSKVLEPVPVGAHGETVRGLLQPGFHSGTVPALFRRLRQAEREASRTRNWQKARTYRRQVEEVESSLHRFLARTLVALLRQSRSWQNEPIDAGEVRLATNRIRFELRHSGHPDTPVEVEIEHHSHWLVAGIRSTGWLGHLQPDQQRAFATGLAGLYKLAGIDLVREQLLSSLPTPPAAARLTYEGLQVWWDMQNGPTSYPLRRRPADPQRADLLHRLVFARTAITWEQWVACWRSDQEGQGQPCLPGLTELLLPRTISPPSAAEKPVPLPPESEPPAVAADVAQTNPA